MASITTKKIKGNEYLYLVDSLRKGEKVIQKSIKYIGPKRPIPQSEFDCMLFSYKNEDWILTRHEDVLPYTHHQEMKKASQQYQQHLSSLDSVSKEKEQQRFLSIFIAGSNAIEGSTMTAKDTFEFLFKDTVPPDHSKKELFMASNLLEAWKYVEKNHHRLPTPSDLKELHARVNKGIESEETVGQYKKVQNYIGDRYTSSYLFVKERMKSLWAWIQKSFKLMNEFEIAFQSHAQFEIIHPFVDGNGRVGRLLLNWLLLYHGLMPFAIRSTKRSDYITALENTRCGKIEAICLFCYQEYMEQYKFM